MLITKRNRLHPRRRDGPDAPPDPDRGLAHRADPTIVASALGVHRETPLHYLIGDMTAEDLTSVQTPRGFR